MKNCIANIRFFRYFVPLIQPVANTVLDDSMQEYNQDLVLVQGAEVVYWKLLEVNTYYLFLMKIAKLKNTVQILFCIKLHDN